MEFTLDEEDIKQALDSAKAVKDFVVAIIKEKINEDKKQSKSKIPDK